MSEFQQYQFQTIDQPLTEAQRKEVNTWSSRGVVSSTSATFTYNYGSFKKDEKKALEDYFDAMLYVANWGTKQLMFRFPKEIVDQQAIQQYAIAPTYSESYLKVYTKGEYLILDINSHDEEGGDWIDDDEYQLGNYISLREQIINGDYRCLKMAWLAISKGSVEVEEEYEDEYGDEEENSIPPIPTGLKKLNAPLKAFQEFFEIEKEVLADAIEQSGNITSKKIDYVQLLPKLSAKEKDEYLVKLINGEPRLDIKLKKRLEAL